MSFEDKIQQSIFQQPQEKSFIDKILAKQDVDAIREFIKKPSLTREDLLQLQYYLSSSETKLFNFTEWERYIILKLFIWIRDFIKIAEQLYDYSDDLEKKEDLCYSCKKKVDAPREKDRCKCEKPESYMVLSERTKQLLENNRRLIEHNIKFLIDLYLNIARSSLSVKGMGFMEILTNKYELSYPQQQSLSTPQQQQKGLFGWKKGG